MPSVREDVVRIRAVGGRGQALSREIAMDVPRRMGRRHAANETSEEDGCEEGSSMNLVVWLPGFFLLGLVAMAACYAFIGTCEKI